MTEVYQRARAFIYRNARPLDMARFQYLFEGGSKDAVLNALSYYQNPDGGFGHALEEDSWNPHSAPIPTWTATKLLRKIEFYDANYPLVAGLLNYLASGADFDGKFWAGVVETNNAYPHAPWWEWSKSESEVEDDNPTVSLASFYLRCAPSHATFYATAERVLREAFARFLVDPTPKMHTLYCFTEAAADGVYRNVSGIDCRAVEEKLRKDVRQAFEKDVSLWATEYVCKPSFLISGPDSPYYADSREIADYECGFIERTQQENGVWPITWQWSAYPAEYAVSANWWRTDFAIRSLQYLAAFHRL